MDFYYDGQIRRYVTQFMRVFIGFKYQAGDGEQRQIPVMYGDLTRQVASIIKDNSENKMPTVPRIACYITGLEMDTNRLSDPTFISKIHIRERRFTDASGTREYTGAQGGSYTVERLMPTPFKLTMKADLWTSNTDQKLQLLEQILVLFNPSLELQTTDNYIDWTSLSAMYLTSTNFSSRTIPQGAESDIDICSLEFEMPVFISPPAKVKKLGIVQSIVANLMDDEGNVINLEDLIYNNSATGHYQPGNDAVGMTQSGRPFGRYGVLLFKSNTGNPNDNQYDLTLVNPVEAVTSLGLSEKEVKNGEPIDWNIILNAQGGYVPGSEVSFKKPNGLQIIGTFVINPLDPSILIVSLDTDTYPGNDDIVSAVPGVTAGGTIDAIIDPYKYNPLEVYGSHAAIPIGLRFLMLDDVNNSVNRGGYINLPSNPADSTSVPYRGPQAWREPSNNDSSWENQDGTDPIIKANSVVEWTGRSWTTIWDPDQNTVEVADTLGEEFAPFYIQNIRTGIKYKWDGTQWIKAFEGEYLPGEWNFRLAGG
jgi:hypothetical protein